MNCESLGERGGSEFVELGSDGVFVRKGEREREREREEGGSAECRSGGGSEDEERATCLYNAEIVHCFCG